MLTAPHMSTLELPGPRAFKYFRQYFATSLLPILTLSRRFRVNAEGWKRTFEACLPSTCLNCHAHLFVGLGRRRRPRHTISTALRSIRADQGGREMPSRKDEPERRCVSKRNSYARNVDKSIMKLRNNWLKRQRWSEFYRSRYCRTNKLFPVPHVDSTISLP